MSHRYTGLGGYSFEGVAGFIPAAMPGAVNLPQTPRRVSCSGFHAWLKRPPSKHRQEDERLKVAIRAILQKNGLVTSMSRKGNCYDNAPIESFRATSFW
ncbi:MAG: hypothetical protein ACYDCW_15750 [Acidithiobacillus ferrivorans]